MQRFDMYCVLLVKPNHYEKDSISFNIDDNRCDGINHVSLQLR